MNKRTIIQRYFFSFLGIIILSCSNSKSTSQNSTSGYQLIKTQRLTNYKLLSFASNADTIMVVAQINATEKCIKENLFSTMLEGNSRINSINDNGEEISFVYYIKGGENNNLKILNGSKKPGNTKKQINSYNCLPIFYKAV